MNHPKSTDKEKTVEQWVEELVSEKGMPCCPVCDCSNGKKIHCACHRAQIREALTSIEKSAYARGREDYMKDLVLRFHKNRLDGKGFDFFFAVSEDLEAARTPKENTDGVEDNSKDNS